MSIDSLKMLLPYTNDPRKDIDIFYNISKEYLAQSADSSMLYIEQAIRLADSLKDHNRLINASTHQIKIYTSLGEHEASYRLVTRVDSLIALHGTPLQYAELLFQKGELNITTGNYSDALSAYGHSKQLFEDGNEPKMYMNAYEGMGNVYKRMDSLQRAQEIFEDLLIINEGYENEKRLRLRFMNATAAIHADQGNYFEALSYLDALVSEYKSSTFTYEDSAALKLVLNNVGIIYLNLEDFEESIRYYLSALDLGDKKIPTQYLAILYGNLGESYIELEKYDTAHNYYLEAYKIANQLKDPYEIAYAEYSLGKSSFCLQKYDASKRYFLKSLNTFHELGLASEASKVDLELARLEQRLQNYDLALEYALSANEATKQTVNNWDEQQAAKILAELYEQLGDADASLAYYKRYNELFINRQDPSMMRKIFTHQVEMEHQREAERLALQQEAEKKNRKNIVIVALLSLAILSLFAWNRYHAIAKKNKLITQQSEELQQLNKTKDKLFTIIGHDLRGPIGGLEAVLNMFLSKDLNEEEFIEMAKELKQNTSSIHQMLENLLEWANAQMQGNINAEAKQLDIQEQIESVTNFIQEVAKAKQIQINNKVTEQIDVFADPNHTNLILRNLLSNAIKFTNAKGEIFIEVEKTNKEATISIKDNGVGMNERQVAALFMSDITTSTWGTANEKGIGLGLKLCKEMVEENGGRIWVESEPDEGSKFSFTLPLTA